MTAKNEDVQPSRGYFRYGFTAQGSRTSDELSLPVDSRVVGDSYETLWVQYFLVIHDEGTCFHL